MTTSSKTNKSRKDKIEKIKLERGALDLRNPHLRPMWSFKCEKCGKSFRHLGVHEVVDCPICGEPNDVYGSGNKESRIRIIV